MNRLFGRTTIRHQHSFAKLFRTSKFVQLGDFNGRIVVGKVVHRINNDLYIDFGFKFNAVCKTPIKDKEKYLVGSQVLLKLYDTELSERFLGSRYDLTLLEADADLIGLYYKKSKETASKTDLLSQTASRSEDTNTQASPQLAT